MVAIESLNLAPIIAGHVHELGPIEVESNDPDVEFRGGQYPTTIIHTDDGQYHLNHFSQFEPGFEGEPDLLTRYSQERDEFSQDVVFGFDRVVSSESKFIEFRLTSGLIDGGIGNAGSLKAVDIDSISRFMALLLTGHVEYSDVIGKVRLDLKALSFFIDNGLIHESFSLGQPANSKIA